MYKNSNRILNSQIQRIIAQAGHFQKIVICDAGLPIPNSDNAVVIDLALIDGCPSFMSVFQAIINELVVQKIYLAQETMRNNVVYQTIKLANIPLDFYDSHEIFKENIQDVLAYIRTGECLPYANVILECGVNF